MYISHFAHANIPTLCARINLKATNSMIHTGILLSYISMHLEISTTYDLNVDLDLGDTVDIALTHWDLC